MEFSSGQISWKIMSGLLCWSYWPSYSKNWVHFQCVPSNLNHALHGGELQNRRPDIEGETEKLGLFCDRWPLEVLKDREEFADGQGRERNDTCAKAWREEWQEVGVDWNMVGRERGRRDWSSRTGKDQRDSNKSSSAEGKEEERRPGQGTFLAVQWLRICLPVQGTGAQPLIGKLRSHMPRSN